MTIRRRTSMIPDSNVPNSNNEAGQIEGRGHSLLLPDGNNVGFAPKPAIEHVNHGTLGMDVLTGMAVGLVVSLTGDKVDHQEAAVVNEVKRSPQCQRALDLIKASLHEALENLYARNGATADFAEVDGQPLVEYLEGLKTLLSEKEYTLVYNVTNRALEMLEDTQERLLNSESQGSSTERKTPRHRA